MPGTTMSVVAQSCLAAEVVQSHQASVALCVEYLCSTRCVLLLTGGCGGRACRLPVPGALRHVAAGGGSNTFRVQSAVVRPISGGGDQSGSYTTTPRSPSRCSSPAASGAAVDGAPAADGNGGSSSSSSSSSSSGPGGRGRGHDAATVFREGAAAYNMPPLQLVPPGTTFDPNAPPEVQVRSMALRLSRNGALSAGGALLAAASCSGCRRLQRGYDVRSWLSQVHAACHICRRGKRQAATSW